MTTRPRVLLVTFNRLIPADQGNARRIMQLVGLYKRQGFEVDLVYHNEEGLDTALSAALASEFGRVTVVQSGASKRIQHPGHICHISDWYDPTLDAVCRHLHRLRGYKVVHANYVWYAPLLEQFGRDVVKVLDTHDVFANRSEKYTRAGMKPQWFSTTLADEDMALKLADAALAIQKEEAAEMADRGHRNILYLPYVEPCIRPFRVPDGSRPLTFGYLGSGNDWNILSMAAFLGQFQKRTQTFPHPIVVAGGISKHVRERPGVIKLGFVKELHSFYDAIDIAINPMIGGTGLKIKTVEPLCYGKPVLTTPSGAQGLSHLWQLPVLADPVAMVDFLFDHLAAADSPTVAELTQQAQATRQALDAEYDGQVERFAGWLNWRL